MVEIVAFESSPNKVMIYANGMVRFFGLLEIETVVVPKNFLGWSLQNLNYTKSNKKRRLYIDKKTLKYIKSYNFFIKKFLF